MNQIIQRREAPATTQQPPQIPSMVLSSHLEPTIRWRKIQRKVSAFVKEAHRYRDSSHRGDTDHLGRQLPSPDALAAIARDLENAAARKATRAEISKIVAAMCDGFATFDARSNAGYLDLLLMAVEIESETEPFSPSALALAALDVLAEERFAPPAGVLLKATREAQKRIESGARLTRMAIDEQKSLMELAQ
ncbi:hypothetical protein KHP62_02425 [Rhodobacteraceae bacterium NNCM2]|nr:hypothetical protein [Coraliihabitans acroporae]